MQLFLPFPAILVSSASACWTLVSLLNIQLLQVAGWIAGSRVDHIHVWKGPNQRPSVPLDCSSIAFSFSSPTIFRGALAPCTSLSTAPETSVFRRSRSVGRWLFSAVVAVGTENRNIMSYSKVKGEVLKQVAALDEPAIVHDSSSCFELERTDLKIPEGDAIANFPAGEQGYAYENNERDDNNVKGQDDQGTHESEDEDPLSWTMHKHLRIKLMAYKAPLLNTATKAVLETLREIPGIIIKGPVYLPTVKKRFTLLRSPFVHKDAQDQFQINSHSRLIDVYRAVNESNPHNNSSVTINDFARVSIPPMVGYEVRLEDIRKPLKDKKIKEQFKPRWTSKYLEYKWDMQDKKPLIKELLSKHYKRDLLYDWPKTFHELKKFPIYLIQKMLDKAKWKRAIRVRRKELGIPRYMPKWRIVDY